MAIITANDHRHSLIGGGENCLRNHLFISILPWNHSAKRCACNTWNLSENKNQSKKPVVWLVLLADDFWHFFCPCASVLWWLFPVYNHCSWAAASGGKHWSIGGWNLRLSGVNIFCRAALKYWVASCLLWLRADSPNLRELNRLIKATLSLQGERVSFWRPRSGWPYWWSSWAARGPCLRRHEFASRLLGGWHKTWSRTLPGP